MSHPRNYYSDQNQGRHHYRTSSGYDNNARYEHSHYSNQYRSPVSTYNQPNQFQSHYEASPHHDRNSTPRQNNNRGGPPMDLQLRTLKVTGYHQDVTKDLLRELFIQVGPIKNVVFKPDHTFIEFADEDSVGYALAAMSNVTLFNVPLLLEPKVPTPTVYRYLDHLNSYHANPDLFLGPFPQN